MPYCKNCGTKMPEGAAYCPNCGAPVKTVVKPVLAGWGERFVAWLIDIITIGSILAPIRWFVAWPWEP